jgi:hypothetical protein
MFPLGHQRSGIEYTLVSMEVTTQHQSAIGSTSSSSFERALIQSASSCERALKTYLAATRLTADQDLVRAVIPAIAAMHTCADYLDAHDRERDLVFRLVRDACQKAAEQCRRYGLDAELLHCAAICERAADLVDLARSGKSTRNENRP